MATVRAKAAGSLTAALITLTGGMVMATETPKHAVESKFVDFEVRQYAPAVIAETEISRAGGDASTEGFKRLAGYIFGGNRGKQSIAMTAPVVKSEGQQIAMTAPVSMSDGAGAGTSVVNFTMPSTWTLETLPVPNDPRVRLRALGPRRVAVMTYSGTWSESRYQAHVDQLRAAVKREGLRPVGAPRWARYDPPWTPWFLRHNEVQLELEPTP